jgi:hypothetical protein
MIQVLRSGKTFSVSCFSSVLWPGKRFSVPCFSKVLRSEKRFSVSCFSKSVCVEEHFLPSKKKTIWPIEVFVGGTSLQEASGFVNISLN